MSHAMPQATSRVMPCARLFPGESSPQRPALIGMVHLPPLPGSPGYDGDWPAVLEAARRDAAALVAGGADAVMVENFHDTPFFKTRVPRITIAAMSRAAAEVKGVAGAVPVGVNVLRNDGRAALAVALAAGCDFLRVNVLCGARVTDQGLIEGIAAELLRERRMFHAEQIAVWADVDVKHSAALAPRPIEEEVADTLVRGGAQALIVSGAGTGRPTDPDKLAAVKRAAGSAPVLVGSGATLETVAALAPHADGFIVGTTFRQGGGIDAERVRQFREILHEGPAA